MERNEKIAQLKEELQTLEKEEMINNNYLEDHKDELNLFELNLRNKLLEVEKYHKKIVELKDKHIKYSYTFVNSIEHYKRLLMFVVERDEKYIDNYYKYIHSQHFEEDLYINGKDLTELSMCYDEDDEDDIYENCFELNKNNIVTIKKLSLEQYFNKLNLHSTSILQNNKQ